MEYGELKNLPLLSAVFLLVFLGGLGLMLLLHQPAAKRRPAAPPPAVRGTTGAPRGLPPLELPRGAKARPCPENSWEYTGEIAANFVSARGQLNSWFQNRSWRPEKRITLDASLKPQMILTFSNREYELTLLIWKIKTDLTGFSYRRDKKSQLEGEIIQ